MAAIELISPGPLAQIALALRGRLELAFPRARFVHQWMPSRIDRDVWDKLTRRVPMVGIGFVKFGDVQTTSDLNVASEWMVWLVSRNENGPEASLFGDALAPGQLVLAEAGAAVLHGFKIPDHGTVQVKDGSNAFIEDFKQDGLSITAIELSVPADLSLRHVVAGEAVTPAALTGQTITWHFDGATVTDNITGTS